MRCMRRFWQLLLFAFGLWLSYGGVTFIYEAYLHEGGGEVPVWAGRSGDMEVVDMRWGNEREYKSDRYVGGGLLLMFGGAICYYVWREARHPGSVCS